MPSGDYPGMVVAVEGGTAKVNHLLQELTITILLNLSVSIVSGLTKYLDL